MASIHPLQGRCTSNNPRFFPVSRTAVSGVASCLLQHLLVFRPALGFRLSPFLFGGDLPLELMGFNRHQQRCCLAKQVHLSIGRQGEQSKRKMHGRQGHADLLTLTFSTFGGMKIIVVCLTELGSSTRPSRPQRLTETANHVSGASGAFQQQGELGGHRVIAHGTTQVPFRHVR